MNNSPYEKCITSHNSMKQTKEIDFWGITWVSETQTNGIVFKSSPSMYHNMLHGRTWSCWSGINESPESLILRINCHMNQYITQMDTWKYQIKEGIRNFPRNLVDPIYKKNIDNTKRKGVGTCVGSSMKWDGMHREKRRGLWYLVRRTPRKSGLAKEH
jgi:hypothetical protein